MCPAGEERAGFGCSCWLSGETGVNGPSGFSQQSNGKMQVELGDNSDSMVCRTMENTYGSYHRSLAQGTAKFHINPHSPSNPPPDTHTHKHIPPSLTAWPSSSGSIYTSPMPGIQDCLATRVSKGSDQRGAWKMVWVIWNKDTARTRVIWGRVMVSQGNPRPATRLLH